MSYAIYVLTEPGTDIPRYVGMSRRPLARMYEHFMAAAQPDTMKNHTSTAAQWLTPLILSGRQPAMTIVELLPFATKQEALAAERRWIADLLYLGCPLVNEPPGRPRPKVFTQRALDRMDYAIQAERREDPPGAYGSRARVARAAGLSGARISQFRKDPWYREQAGLPPLTANSTASL